MTEKVIAQTQVVLERTLLLEMLESGERVLSGMSDMVNGLRTIATTEGPTTLVEPIVEIPEPKVITTTEPAAAAAPVVNTAVEPRVWDLTDDALANYDAEQLVALRADHRADKHDPAGCRVCDVLARRLGSL